MRWLMSLGFTCLSARKFFIMAPGAARPRSNPKGFTMQNAVTSSEAIADYFKLPGNSDSAEMEVFGQIIAEILQTGMPVTNKAIISSLIYRLELESDVLQLDIYRHLLELVVNKTPDDLSV